MPYGDGECERCRRVTYVVRVGYSWLCQTCKARRG